MITEEEVIQILNEWEFGANLKNGEFVRGVKNEYYKDVARAIVSKNESLYDVINCDCETDNYTKHESTNGIIIYKCKDCGGCL